MKYARLVLVLLLILISVGYHAMANARDSLNDGIYYDNIDYTDNVVFNGTDGVNMDYSAKFINPGDYYELYFDVVNSTDYNMAISNCIYHENDEYINYELTYEDGSVINIGDIINKHERVRVKYKVMYMNYIDEDDYTIDTSFSILYTQVI